VCVKLSKTSGFIAKKTFSVSHSSHFEFTTFLADSARIHSNYGIVEQITDFETLFSESSHDTSDRLLSVDMYV